MSSHIPRKETFKGHPDLPKTEAEILQKGGPRPGRFRCALVYLSLSVLEFVQQSFRCACLPDCIFSFTLCRVYKEGDHDLPEFPSYFQVAKYSVFERVSDFMHQSQ